MADETISQAISDIRKQFPNMDGLDSEEDVKLFVIERVLEALDWNLRQRREVRKEYPVGRGRADYALNPDLPTAAFIEAKKPTANLENHNMQLLNYCFQLETVNLAVLTNGRTWWLYLPGYEGNQGERINWTKKRFSEIDITSGKPSSIQKEFERFLAKDKVSSGEAVESAKGLIDDKIRGEQLEKAMREAWNNLATVPSEDLIKLLTESTFQVCNDRPNRKQVRDFFQQHRAQLKVSDTVPPKGTTAIRERTSRQNGKPSFIFNDTPGSARTWKQLLLAFCKLVYADPDRQGHFDQIIKVRGTKTRYFSRNPVELRDPEEIEESGIFAATSPLSALGVKQRCQMVLREFNYREDSLKI